MELLFTPEEKRRVKTFLEIDMDRAIDALMHIEDVTSPRSIGYFRERFPEYESIIRGDLRIKEVKHLYELRKDWDENVLFDLSKQEPYSYRSLIYYTDLVKRALNNSSFEQTGNEEARVLISLICALLCSIYNHMCYLVELVRPIGNGGRNILVFEACPSDLHKIKTREEVLKIKQTALDKGFNPIIRFGVNIKVFKNTCKDNLFSYLHFAGHGEGNGDLAFVGNTGRKAFLGFLTFESFFSSDAFLSAHCGTLPIKNIYLNSCFSDKYLEKIMHSHSIRSIFEFGCAHKGKNPDSFAIESSSLFYDAALETGSVPNGFFYSQHLFAASLNTKKNVYAANMVLR